MDDCTVELGFVHVCYSCFGVGGVFVEDVGCAAVGHDCHWSVKHQSTTVTSLTLLVHGHVDLFQWAINAKDLLQVFIVDILGELLHHNLCALGR